MLKKKLIITSCLVLALGLSACGSDDGDKAQNGENTEVRSDNNTEDVIDPSSSTSPKEGDIERYNEIKLTAEDAYNTFLEKKPNSKIDEIGLKYNHNRYSYKVEGYDDANEYELEIDALNGEILRADQDKNDNNDRVIALEDMTKIDQLVSKALEENKAGLVSLEWELKIDDNILKLEIEIDNDKDDIEYIYNVKTGELLEKDR